MSGEHPPPRGPTCETTLDYDHIDEFGHKIQLQPVPRQSGGAKEIDLTALVERPGPRYTANPEILRIEAEIGRENLANPARHTDTHPTLGGGDSDVE